MVKIIVTGGAANNQGILQIMADVFGKNVYTQVGKDGKTVTNTAALGAALAARLAHFKSLGVSSIFMCFVLEPILYFIFIKFFFFLFGYFW